MPENFIERPRKNEKDDAVQYVKSLLAQVREDNRNEDIEKLEELVRLLHTKNTVQSGKNMLKSLKKR